MSMTDSLPTERSALRSNAGLAALALVAVMLAGAWQMIAAAGRIDLQKVPLSLSDFREGRTTGALEKQLDLKLPARATLITAANALRYVLLRGGGEQVRIGKDDWLFLTEELRYYDAAATHRAARIDLLAAASAGLARDGVKLVVALVPDKARLYPDRLVEGRLPEYGRTRYQDTLTALQARGVQAVDLLQPLSAARADVYYRSDTHWNQAGARIAAGVIAAAVRRLQPDLAPATFVTEKTGEAHERPGDLIRMMSLSDLPAALRPRADRETPLQTRQTSADSGGLFGDAAVPVVLTGTSYSLRGNFHGFLQQALATKVLNAAQDGSGFLQATTQYLKDEAYRSAKPQVLIWEIPERFLDAPLAGEAGWLRGVGLQP
jgi:alginate O-acetyltransferase complex protein AlgJ